MATIYKVDCPNRKPLFEGVQGENEARSIQFDITPWVDELGDGAVTATAKRPQDSQPYPVTVTKVGNLVTWKPTSTDTAYEGVGSFQLEYTVGGVIAKTCIWSTQIAPSLDPAGDPPDPYDNWLADMRQVAAEALQSAQDAEQSAEDAAQEVENAQAEVYEAEAWAKGTKNGTPVSSTDAQYQNNSKYWAEQSAASVSSITAEVEDIRIGADGITYASAGDAVRGQVSDLKSDLDNTGVPTKTPKLYESDAYPYSMNQSVVADSIISAGTIIKKFTFYSASAFNPAAIYLIRNSDNVCVKHFYMPVSQGWNDVEVNYLCEADVRVGITTSLSLKYTNSNVDAKHAFSNGLNVSSANLPSVGNTVTITKSYSGNFAISIQWETISKYIAQIDINKDNIEELGKSIENNNTQPLIYDDLSKYAYVLNDRSSMSDKEIPADSFISTIEFYSSGTVAAGGGSLFIIRKTDNVCVWYKYFPTVEEGWNTVDVNYYAEEGCYVVQYGLGIKYTNTAVDADHAFSTKIHTTNPYVVTVGNSVTITDYFSGNFALSIKWNVKSGVKTIAEAALDKANNSTPAKIYDHPCIVSFIDDDSGKYVPEIWGSILAQAPIRMGFACITGFMGELETPSEVYEQMSLEDLQALYNDGHEVYSHSYDHPAFYSQNVTLEDIEEQCRLSKQWLEANGFTRNADTIVYPGGLGENETAKQNVIRQFYHYGVDTVGGGINPEPLPNDLCIYRYNADTATLDQLKAKVDEAIAEKKLLVFMNHAYQLNLDKTNQIAKMVAIINYIKSEGGLIIPLNEAIHRIYGW